jgi:hypothetical protein
MRRYDYARGGLLIKRTNLIPVERIEKAIYLIRGEKVMLDAGLAHLYGVTTAPPQSTSESKSRTVSCRLHVPTHGERVQGFDVANCNIKEGPRAVTNQKKP